VRPMKPLSSNGFGTATYWNRPTARSRAKRSTRSLSPAQRTSSPPPPIKSFTQTAPEPPRSFSSNNASQINGKTAISSFLSATPSSPTPSSSHPVHQSGSALQISHRQTLYDERDKQDDKAMVKLMKSALPQFSNEQDWEMASFELKLVLDRVWPHKQAMNISDYLQTTYAHHDRDIARRADSLIYFALTLSAKKDSYAKLQILAACHTDAVPSVMRNEGNFFFRCSNLSSL
jgi:hypothetical protein